MSKRPAAAAVLNTLAALGFTAVLWLVALVIFGFYPFGERSVLITDMGQQYIEYHAALYDTIKGGGSLLYTWNTGLGMNFVGLFAYYLSSPFTLLMFLFPRDSITQAVLAIISVKIAFSGLTFSVYLRRAIKIRGILNIVFSALYGLSAYSAVYFFNIMWLDSVVLLPIAVLALRHTLDTKKIALLTAVFALLFFSNFYTAFMVGLFCLILLLALVWLRGNGKSADYRSAVMRLLAAAGLAAGLTAFLTLPTAFALQESQGSMSGDYLFFGFMTDPLSMIGKMTFGAYDSITDAGTPYTYCGVLTLGLIPLWLFNKKIPRREKAAGVAVIGIVLVSMMFSLFDYVWHAAETPVWFPCRYSFVLVFLLLSGAARAIAAAQGIPRSRIIAGFAVSAAAVVVAKLPELLFPGRLDAMAGNLVITLAALAVYLPAAMLASHSKRWVRRAGGLLLAVLVGTELVGNTVTSFGHLDRELGFESKDSYSDFYDKKKPMTEAVIQAAERDGVEEGEFYRVENYLARNANDGMSAGYRAVSHYSSFSRRDTFCFLKNCGMFCLSGCKIFRYYGSTTALDSVLGVKYVFNVKERRAGYVDTGISAGGLKLWRNQTALPLAFFADDDVLNLPSRADSPFEMLNRLLSSLGGDSKPFYSPLPVTVDFAYCEAEPTDNGYKLTAEDVGTVYLTIDNPKRQNVLLYLDNNLPEFTEVYLNNIRLNQPRERLIKGVIELGELPEGESVVSFCFAGRNCRISDISAAAFDEREFNLLAGRLESGAPETLNVFHSRAGEPVVTGTVTAPEKGVIFTSIPADKGWTAVIDGRKVKPAAVGNAFIALPVDKGRHEFRLCFRPRGMAAGIVISCLTLLLCVFLLILRAVKRRRAVK